ncbi:MAG: hypothetical protein HFH10_03585 [Dorea sp.]|nr:hypothetical protein [Dorea sp.]
MEYYRYLYLSERLEKKKDRIMDRLERNRFQPGIHLILLPANEKNQLEILNAAWLLQPDYPKEGLFVVGIADSFENALEYVEKISREVYDSTKGLDIRNYILMKEREG